MTHTMTYETLSEFVRGLTGWDGDDLERAVCLVLDAQAEPLLLGSDVRSAIEAGEGRSRLLGPVRAAHLRILDSAGLRQELEPFLVEGQRGAEFQIDSEEAGRIMAAVPQYQRGSAWDWLWERTYASSPLGADEGDGQLA